MPSISNSPSNEREDAAALSWFRGGAFPLYLAPMAGYTDLVFRSLCKAEGADVMVTEFVLADHLLRDEARIWETVDFTEAQRPMGVQIFGAEPHVMAEAARRVEARLSPDFIDINYGCPSPRICRQHAGASLLQDLPRLGRIAAAVVRAVPATPVTAKIRIGWDERSIVAVEAARCLEEVGIRVLTVHGRTKVQGYSGDADWSVIAEVAERVGIPVVGNGNVRSSADVLRLRRDTGVRGLMIGRAALGYPWVFRELSEQLSAGSHAGAPGLQERWETMIAYAEALLERPHIGPQGNRLHWMRPRLKFFTKRLPGGRRLREAIESVETVSQLRDLAARHCSEYGDGPVLAPFDIWR